MGQLVIRSNWRATQEIDLLSLVGIWILGTVLGSEFLVQELSCGHASCVVCVLRFPNLELWKTPILDSEKHLSKLDPEIPICVRYDTR